MNWTGKKVVFLGDSITAGAKIADKKNIYHQIIKDKLRLKEAVNCGISGTRIARQKTPSQNVEDDKDFNQRAETLDCDADYIVVFGGTNDFGHGDAAFGEMEDDTVWTFSGACRVLFKTLIKNYGKEKILLFLPLHRINEESLRGDGRKKVDGYPLVSYVERMKMIAQEFGIKILDFWKEEKLNPNIGNNREKYFPDGLHPNEAGHKLIADFICKNIKRL